MVSAQRHAKLADFGLAKRLHEPHGDAGAWLSGTPNYMAPELFQGQPADKRSDVYAMGVTFYLLLTGSLPAIGESITDLMQWHSQRTPTDVRELRPDIPENAARLVERCLAKNPADRPTDATQLHHELRAVYGSLRSLESLLRESLHGTGIAIQGEARRFELDVKLAGDRQQRVVVETCDSLAIAEQVVRIYSICGPAEERHFRRALELNPQFAHGAIGLENVRGVPYFVMTNAFPRATCDPEEIRHSVLGIAQRADDVERCITGRDSH